MAPKLMKSYSGGAMTMSRALLALLVTAAAGAGPPSHRASTPFRPQAGLCKACHQNVFATFVQTAHFHTSAEATTQSIRGRFSGGDNLLRTSSERLYFKMERRDRALYQTGVDSTKGSSTSERIGLDTETGRSDPSFPDWR